MKLAMHLDQFTPLAEQQSCETTAVKKARRLHGLKHWLYQGLKNMAQRKPRDCTLFDDDVTFSYFEKQLWQDDERHYRNLSSSVSPRAWRRHSALLSCIAEQQRCK